MTKEETKKAIEVMQAYVDGKEIECRCKDRGEQWVYTVHPSWDWVALEYRVKPQPREWLTWIKDGQLKGGASCDYIPGGEPVRVREVLE